MSKKTNTPRETSPFTVELTDAERRMLQDLADADGRIALAAAFRKLLRNAHALWKMSQAVPQGGVLSPAPRKPTPADLHDLVAAERHRRAKAGEPSLDENSLAYEPLDAA